MSKLQLGVIFGSRSCEREVSIISALQMMNQADTEKYDVVPVYISQEGTWYTGSALRELSSYTPFNPEKKGIEAVNLDLTSGSGALLAYRPGKGLFSPAKLEVAARLDVCVIVMHASTARTAPCRACWKWQICPIPPRAWQAAPSAWTRS